MPKKVESIVKGLKKKGHDEQSAYALANYIYNQTERRSKRKKGKK
jgi:hypothetical protein